MRVDARPRIRGRFAAIIKTCPHKPAAQPRTVGEVTPPAFGCVRPAGEIHVIGADVAAPGIVLVNAARADCAALFSADVRLVGMLGVVIIHLAADMIIPAAHLQRTGQSAKDVAHAFGGGHGPRRIKPLHEFLHRPADPTRHGLCLLAFLVADAPNGDAGVITVAANLGFPATQICLVAAEQAVFIHHDQAEAVAGVEQLRRGRVMRGPVGVAAKFFQFPNAEGLERIRQRRAYASHVLMVAGAV